jgi:L-2,4-diaminobutyric acid acetyltransferase
MPDTNDGNDSTSLRPPTLRDAGAIWQLVNDSRILDRNSSYLYLLLCRDFAETCLVAERNAEVIGFVTAYRPPRRADVLFIWQIGVAPSARRQGLASRMLSELVGRAAEDGCLRFVEATVSPSNQASLRTFESLAARLGSRMTQDTGFTSSDFPGSDHEPEPLIRIGPLQADKREASLSGLREETRGLKAETTGTKERSIP